MTKIKKYQVSNFDEILQNSKNRKNFYDFSFDCLKFHIFSEIE